MRQIAAFLLFVLSLALSLAAYALPWALVVGEVAPAGRAVETTGAFYAGPDALAEACEGYASVEYATPAAMRAHRRLQAWGWAGLAAQIGLWLAYLVVRRPSRPSGCLASSLTIIALSVVYAAVTSLVAVGRGVPTPACDPNSAFVIEGARLALAGPLASLGSVVAGLLTVVLLVVDRRSEAELASPEERAAQIVEAARQMDLEREENA